MSQEANETPIADILKNYMHNLVSHPNDLKVVESVGEKSVNITITPHPEDLGVIFGKRGFNIDTIKKMGSILGNKRHKRVTVNVLD